MKPGRDLSSLMKSIERYPYGSIRKFCRHNVEELVDVVEEAVDEITFELSINISSFIISERHLKLH